MNLDFVMMEIAVICGIAAAVASLIGSLIPQAKYIGKKTAADSK